jgi:hypothetical protein
MVFEDGPTKIYIIVWYCESLRALLIIYIVDGGIL